MITILLLIFALICILLMLNKQQNKEGFLYHSTIPSNCVEDIFGNIKCYPAYYYSPLYTPWPRYRRYPYRRRGFRRH